MKRLFLSIAGLYLTLAIALLLTLMSVRVVMTPLFLQLEYHRPGFPDDRYGFTLDDRLRLAPYAVNYLLNGEGIDYLGDLTFPDGSPLYTDRELMHMEDVKAVTQISYLVMVIVGGFTLALAVWLSRTPERYAVLRQGLFNGAALTLGLIVMIVAGAVIAWDVFFTSFHQMFFADGTWVFLYSDTLIRLFPEQFWFDAALVIGTLTVIGAFVIIFLTSRLRPQEQAGTGAKTGLNSGESGL